MRPPGGLPLSSLRPGERAVVRRVAGGRGVVARLASLGFTPGATVTMIQNFGRGPLIVEVRGARIALGRREAARVWVQPAPALSEV
ncbi:MAG: ferrous iron transport protein A [Anaerolineae bacterium]|nr:ferrous iron transport protein A [Anaerolineae bacterium]